MTFTVGSLFSGIGGLDLAAHWAGFETAWFVEKEPFCQKVLAKHWPNVPIHDDVFTCKDMPHVDVIVGGFPCQPFSVAGNQQGANDERYLLPEMLRIIQESKPHAVIFENVTGFPTLTNGAEFKHLLRMLANMGLYAQWGHIRASDVKAPHPRERWFLVAYCPNASQSATEYTARGQSWKFGRGNGRSGEQGNRVCESRLDGVTNGLPSRLDFVGFPAGRNQSQFDYEPPRTSLGTRTTKARIKALGNAVVPQVAYPIFEALMEWFKEDES